jgi:hypothetical protein
VNETYVTVTHFLFSDATGDAVLVAFLLHFTIQDPFILQYAIKESPAGGDPPPHTHTMALKVILRHEKELFD